MAGISLLATIIFVFLRRPHKVHEEPSMISERSSMILIHARKGETPSGFFEGILGVLKMMVSRRMRRLLP